MLLIDEHFDAQGALLRTYLEPVTLPAAGPNAPAGEIRARLVCDSGVRAELPVAAVDAVMRRYGKPLEPEVVSQASANEASVDLGGGRRLGTLRFRALVDASSRDYLVWWTPGHEPIAALACTAAAALRYLASSRSAAG